MEIEIIKVKDGKEVTEYLTITDYSIVVKPDNMFLFKKEFIEEENKEKYLH